MNIFKFIYFISALTIVASLNGERERVELAAVPSVSPNGKQITFVWRRDLWVVSIDGGEARQLTRHPASDHWPSWSPNGREIAFSSKRDGYWNIFRIPAAGGDPIQITDHSEGYLPLEWYPDGKNLLTQGIRDHGGLDSERLFKVDVNGKAHDQLVFNAYARNGTVSPDGKKILFVREGKNLLYRKGYHGAKASQIWLYEVLTGNYISVLREDSGTRSPMWKPDSSGFYYVGAQSGSFNLWEKNLNSGEEKQLTFFEDDSVILPRISRNGETIVFRYQFEFYRYHPLTKQAPKKIEIWSATDTERKVSRRRWYDSAWNNEASQGLAWTDDFLEMSFSAGGDLWVMDTILREPRLVCGSTSSHETEVVFDKEDETLFFLRDFGDHVGIWKARKDNPDDYWFNSKKFIIEPFSDDSTAKTLMKLSPDGDKLAYVRGRGELVITDIRTHKPMTLFNSDVRPWYEWSPDGKWMVAQAKDSNDNWDIWIISTDGASEPYNLSRHPGWDGGPRWSPNGKMISFVGRRGRDDEMDLFYVYLSPEYERLSERSAKLSDAENLLRKARGSSTPSEKKITKSSIKEEDKWLPPAFDVEFRNLSDRIKRIKLPNSKETDPFWHSASRKLGFSSDIQGQRGTYYVVIPDDLTPRFVTKSVGKFHNWHDNELHWMVENLPSKMTGTSIKKYTFKAYQNTNREEYLKLGYRIIWRNLRDYYYDGKLNNKDWKKILNKYEKHITSSIDRSGYIRLISMMFGELNSSHLFFDAEDKHWPSWSTDNGWRRETVHLGLTFYEPRKGIGLRIKTVIPNGPCDHPDIDIKSGDILISINGNKITRNDLYTKHLNNRLTEPVRIKTTRIGKIKTNIIEPTTYSQARYLLKDAWIKNNRIIVSKVSSDKIGYLHVDKMRWDNLEKFGAEIFSRGFDKDSMIIDVRNNTGGFTADRMLYTLIRPIHANTIPRGGMNSYPQGYLEYPFWDKPIVVLCNQNTSSNGEIFCHAIKTMKRGALIGTPTSGSVISIYSNEKILDLGNMSVPFRGWYIHHNQKNMEGNGAIPDILIWPKPGEIPSGIDTQLMGAIKQLQK
tara:strand:+ start:8697 stop:11909 length:3213 start_codon:yes stop_codon:yes gene_type:complete